MMIDNLLDKIIYLEYNYNRISGDGFLFNQNKALGGAERPNPFP